MGCPSWTCIREYRPARVGAHVESPLLVLPALHDFGIHEFDHKAIKYVQVQAAANATPVRPGWC